jgi:hypothetical protein
VRRCTFFFPQAPDAVQRIVLSPAGISYHMLSGRHSIQNRMLPAESRFRRGSSALSAPAIRPAYRFQQTIAAAQARPRRPPAGAWPRRAAQPCRASVARAAPHMPLHARAFRWHEEMTFATRHAAARQPPRLVFRSTQRRTPACREYRPAESRCRGRMRAAPPAARTQRHVAGDINATPLRAARAIARCRGEQMRRAKPFRGRAR